MAEDFFSRIKQAKSKPDQPGPVNPGQVNPGPVNPVPMDPVYELRPKTWTREELEEYITVQGKASREITIRQIASDIMQNLCTREDGNLSAGDCARWCVQAAVALMKYSKQAAENEESIWSEDEDCNDFLYAPGDDYDD